MISPQNIQSLTLYNNNEIPDQISIFLLHVCLRQLTRLQSIHLFGIDEFQLNYLLKRINLNLLQLFSIQISKYDNRRRKTSVNHLTKILQQPTVRKLHFNIENLRISESKWPMNCSIACLTIVENITLNDLVEIYSCCPQLHRLIIKGQLLKIDGHRKNQFSFAQIRSLIVENVNAIMNEIQTILLLTPSLIYLRLIASFDTFDGKILSKEIFLI